MADPCTIIAKGKAYTLPILVSPDDYDWLMGMGTWIVTHGAGARIGYAARTIWNAKAKAKVLLFMHKLVLERHMGPAPTPAHRIGDHINGRTLDNQRHNLRWATPSMNARNRYGIAHRQPDLFEVTI